MKKYRNTSNRHLQFPLAGIELAPGQEIELADSVVRNDPGFETCLDRGMLEDLATQNRTTGSKKESKKRSSKSDLFESNDGQQPDITGFDGKDE